MALAWGKGMGKGMGMYSVRPRDSGQTSVAEGEKRKLSQHRLPSFSYPNYARLGRLPPESRSPPAC